MDKRRIKSFNVAKEHYLGTDYELLTTLSEWKGMSEYHIVKHSCGYVYKGGNVCPKCGFKNNA